MPRVVVVGGGITGLAAAHRLTRIAAPGELQVTLVESSDRLGGVIRTESLAGRRVDTGPESIFARVPEGPSLCRELGLAGDLVTPAQDQPFVWTRGRLRPLPPRLLAGIPGGTRTLAATGVLSSRGMLRAGLDLLVPSRELDEDVSIGSLVRRRLGDEVHERLIQPLLGGIHAGDCDRLSVLATAPQFAAALGSGRGLVHGLRAAAGPHANPGPMFVTLTGGLECLVAALAERLTERVELRTCSAVAKLTPSSGGRSELTLSDGELLVADHVVLAVPALAAAEILAAAWPETGVPLRAIEYASVATVTLAYPASALPRPPAGSGFLVPRTECRLVTACTWSSAKWAHLAGEAFLLRASVGHAGDGSALELPDERLVDAVHSDLAAAMGLRAEPFDFLVTRFPAALPQYLVGHLDRLRRLESALAGVPAVKLAGAAYRGAGIGACIRSGEAAATAVAASLGPAGARRLATAI